MWWKYLDRDTMLPPPFTVLYFFHCFLRWIAVNINNACCAKLVRTGDWIENYVNGDDLQTKEKM